MEKSNFLVVDDNKYELTDTLSKIVASGHEAKGVLTVKDAMASLRQKRYTFLLTDIHLTESDELKPRGLDLLQDVKCLFPNVLPLAMSKDPDVAIFDRAIAYGALQFIKKPVKNWDEIQIAVSLARSRKALQGSNSSLTRNHQIPEDLRAKYPDGIVLRDSTRNKIKALSQNRDIPLVLSGETGTGKEEVAMLLHRERVVLEGDIPFVAVNCSHFRSDLAQSQLFGHQKGAFTGANDTTVGLVGQANGGILFLDEIHYLPKTSQRDLLRVLNDGHYQRVGSTETLHSRFQLVAATTSSLDDAVAKGLIILDLASRLMGAQIELSPLRERREDLKDLIAIFFAKRKKEISESQLEDISAKCGEYYWQGNIRMLFQILKVMIMEAEFSNEPVSSKHLPDLKLMRDPAGIVTHSGSDLDRIGQRVASGDLSYEEALNNCDKRILEHVVRKTNTIADAISLLDISRSAFDSRRKKYDLQI
ncbi:sigma-54-dependent transcriptional regulator [Pseudobacteriovorax antillogorgiicola]|uniref:DNA-binding transcriptional response regulator, NtrC family, contains REC, AAA-type ATPase, and a Fis-type DNA-binding domains n=1 Tax=Pseudobacteriovorax antillogorgiicola TaxID=1513793 RepID=A0A1Y6B718_9BACT|nr:sigma 54-interacting transcriptional regulator [Pseudobacteriovorax antillogorgiicola]TCS58664.1 DNA-binding NtrC family response regulator [Pseudobacteriovorax antillogorgiicola]SME96177.1 DNA-binding transcriptional response regulator, NtrC family, contains REC, AAA-type ATPase, and a Fis-type DNA-binding domains [Pseudobacteriovorax antillogorgiicola]